MNSTPAEVIIDARLNSKVGGALFDFMAFLTTRYQPITLSRNHECSNEILAAFDEWCKTRNFSMPVEPDVQHWNESVDGVPPDDVYSKRRRTRKRPFPGDQTRPTAAQAVDRVATNPIDFTGASYL